MATALTVSMLIVYAAVMSIMSIQRSVSLSQQSTTTTTDASLIVEHLLRHFQATGGSGIPLEGAFYLEEAGCPGRHDLPPCGPNDRLTVMLPIRYCGLDTTNDVEFECPQIPLTNVDFSTNKIHSPATCGGGSRCCLRFTPDNGTAVMSPHDRKHLVVGNDDSRALVRMTALSAGGSPFCDTDVTHNGLYPAVFQSGDVTLPTSLYSVPVDTITFYVDSQKRLIAYYDFDNDGLVDEEDKEVVAVNVESLQFAIGYDVDGDGIITDDGTQNDEVLGNHLFDTMGADGLVGADDTMARTMSVGVIVSAKAPHLTQVRSASVFNGTPVSSPRTTYATLSGTALLRNLDVYY